MADKTKLTVMFTKESGVQGKPIEIDAYGFTDSGHLWIIDGDDKTWYSPAHWIAVTEHGGGRSAYDDPDNGFEIL